jgi:hypothetical protein
VLRVCETVVVSERRACRVLLQARAIQRYSRYLPTEHEKIRSRTIALAEQYGRYGYRRIMALLGAEG